MKHTIKTTAVTGIVILILTSWLSASPYDLRGSNMDSHMDFIQKMKAKSHPTKRQEGKPYVYQLRGSNAEAHLRQLHKAKDGRKSSKYNNVTKGRAKVYELRGSNAEQIMARFN